MSGSQQRVRHSFSHVVPQTGTLIWSSKSAAKHAKQAIPLVLANSAGESLDKNAPGQEATTWIEMFNGQVTGGYEMIIQGTSVSCMVYTNNKKNQKTAFVANTNKMVGGSCKW